MLTIRLCHRHHHGDTERMTWIAPEVSRADGSLTANERETLVGYLNFHRTTFLAKCAGLSGQELSLRPLDQSRLSLLGLARHLRKVERIWFRIRFAGEDVERLYPETDSDFNDIDPLYAELDYTRLVAESRLADAAVASAQLDDTCVVNGEEHSLRLIHMHVITEYARHNGHADLLREYTDGVTGA